MNDKHITPDAHNGVAEGIELVLVRGGIGDAVTSNVAVINLDVLDSDAAARDIVDDMIHLHQRLEPHGDHVDVQSVLIEVTAWLNAHPDLVTCDRNTNEWMSAE